MADEFSIEMQDLEVKSNNTDINWSSESNASGRAMVGLWEARYVHLRVLLYKLNIYFLPALICIGKYLYTIQAFLVHVPFQQDLQYK